MKPKSWVWMRVGRGVAILGLIAAGVLPAPARRRRSRRGPAPEQGGTAPAFEVPRLETVKRLAHRGGLTPQARR